MSMRLPTPFLLLAVVLAACTSITPPSSMPEKERPTNVEQLKQSLVGDGTSIAAEIRPSAARNPDGTLKPFYLRRDFSYLGNDHFQLTVVNSADPYGKVPLARILIRGHMLWRGEHPVASGAQKVDFVADEAYEVTPLLQGFADVMNQVAASGYAKWEVNGTAERLRQDVRSVRPRRRPELHGVRPRLRRARPVVLGRPQRRRARLRQGGEPADEPANPWLESSERLDRPFPPLRFWPAGLSSCDFEIGCAGD
jgi:hypothetical protein